MRDEQAKVLHAIQPLQPEDVLTLQPCAASTAKATIEGKRVPAYREEPSVAPDSNTETFVALKLHIDNWRWADVPFYVRTGKRMAARAHRNRDPVQRRRSCCSARRRRAARRPICW